MKINQNYKNLKDSYLFSTVARKVNEFQSANPDVEVIRLSIGDVTRPLATTVVDAMTEAVAEMGVKETFHGYGPEQGYDFLRNSLQTYYSSHNVQLAADEIFVSDGAKSDLGNFLDLMDSSSVVLIPDPVYPAYVDTNQMSGHKIIYMQANESNDFLPMPDDSVDCDLIYICSPNNPTGAVYTREGLQAWVNYANSKNALIIFDAAYEVFIEDESLPKSIFEIKGARTCAIEICSFSKIAGFTGTRCGYTVVPKDIVCDGLSLNEMWLRRQTTKYNGVPYLVQRGADAVFTEDGFQQIMENIHYYKENAKIIADTFTECGIWYIGGKHSPYIWMKTPNNMTSWECFDFFLEKAGVATTPGSGFGANGEGYVRFTAFGDRDKTKEAMERLKKLLQA